MAATGCFGGVEGGGSVVAALLQCARGWQRGSALSAAACEQSAAGQGLGGGGVGAGQHGAARW